MNSHMISSAHFKEMLMHAGHTKGYLSSRVKQKLHTMKLSNGAQASHLLYTDHAKIHKRDAIKIIKQLKDEHLAHGVIGSPTKFVDTAIRKQRMVEEHIAAQNKADRAKQIAEEHQAHQEQESHATATAHPITPVHTFAPTRSNVYHGRSIQTPQSTTKTPVEKPAEAIDSPID